MRQVWSEKSTFEIMSRVWANNALLMHYYPNVNKETYYFGAIVQEHKFKICTVECWILLSYNIFFFRLNLFSQSNKGDKGSWQPDWTWWDGTGGVDLPLALTRWGQKQQISQNTLVNINQKEEEKELKEEKNRTFSTHLGVKNKQS